MESVGELIVLAWPQETATVPLSFGRCCLNVAKHQKTELIDGIL